METIKQMRKRIAIELQKLNVREYMIEDFISRDRRTLGAYDALKNGVHELDEELDAFIVVYNRWYLCLGKFPHEPSRYYDDIFPILGKLYYKRCCLDEQRIIKKIIGAKKRLSFENYYGIGADLLIGVGEGCMGKDNDGFYYISLLHSPYYGTDGIDYYFHPEKFHNLYLNR